MTNYVCATRGHDLNKDASECLRCGLKTNGDFRLLKFPVVFKAGRAVCALDTTDNEFGGYRQDKQLKRPLAIGEKLCTLGPMGDFRSGTVVSLDPPTVDDGGMYWWPEFDKDDDHAWTVKAFADKRMVDGANATADRRKVQ